MAKCSSCKKDFIPLLKKNGLPFQTCDRTVQPLLLAGAPASASTTARLEESCVEQSTVTRCPKDPIKAVSRK